MADLIKIIVSNPEPEKVVVRERDCRTIKVQIPGMQGAKGEKGDPGEAPDMSLYATKAELAPVALSGDYGDLNGVPVVDSALDADSSNAVANSAVVVALDAKADESSLAGYLPLSGGSLTGSLSGVDITAKSFQTGTATDAYFQCRKFRGEGNASTYYHAIDFGYQNHDMVDFYEYGGVWNFWRNTSASKGGVKVGAITSTGWNGDARLSGSPTAPTPASGDNSARIATTAFVASAVSSGTSSLAKEGDVESLETAVSDLTDIVEGKADKASSLSGYGIEDAYSKGEVDALVANVDIAVDATLNADSTNPIQNKAVYAGLALKLNSATYNTEKTAFARTNQANRYSGEQNFLNSSYCPTIVDSYSGIGCAQKTSRLMANQVLTGQIVAPSNDGKNDATSIDNSTNTIKIQYISAKQSTKPTLANIGTFTPEGGWNGLVNGVDVSTIGDNYYSKDEVDALIAEIMLTEIAETSYDQAIFQSMYGQKFDGEVVAYMGKELGAKDSVHEATIKGVKLQTALFNAYLSQTGTTFTVLQDFSGHIYGAVCQYQTSSGNKSNGSILINGETVATYQTPSNTQGSFNYATVAVDLKAGDVIVFSTPNGSGYPKQYGAFYLPSASTASFLL